MKKFLLVLLALSWQSMAFAQEEFTFKPSRFDEDYAALSLDSNLTWYQKAKYHPLSKNAKTYLSLGGEIRYQYFYFKNEDWGESAKDKDGYILTRYLAHADLHIGKHLRTFLQLQSSLANGKAAAPSAVDENQLDLHQAFIDVAYPLPEQKKIIVRLGRQELSYGSQRLVALRDGPNNRQAYDAGRLIYMTPHVKADAFFSHYVQSKRNIFDDGFNRNTKFWGTYFVIGRIPVVQNIDVYYFGLSKSVASFDDGKGKEMRHSVGSRIWRTTGSWHYDFEGVYQFGKFADKNIAAWTASSNSSYSFSSLKYKPRTGLKTELISGDKNYGDGALNSFNPLFPRGAYFGLAALIGPSNLADIHPSLSLELSKTIDLSFDYDVFWRFSRNDGIYAPNVSLIYSGKNTGRKFIGQQYSSELSWAPNNFLYFRAELTWFKTGAYLKAVGPGKNIFFTGFTTQLKF
ncbi:MAG: hypothetical protein JWQ27_273 [Ferruginibacter sp.]|nr:hypothetical protein [Ferruginibacter sp.]